MTEKKTAEEFMELYLAHELEKLYSDINANRELIEEMMEAIRTSIRITADKGDAL